MNPIRRRLFTILLLALLLAASRAAAVELAIQSNPPGARIIIDNRELSERTPAIVSVPAGDHDLTLKLDGRQTVTRRLQVTGRGFASFELPSLTPAPAAVLLPAPAARPAPAPTPAAPAAVPVRPGDFGPTVTIRYRREPSHAPAPGSRADLNLLPRDSALSASLRPTAPAPVPAAPAPAPPVPASPEDGREVFPLVVSQNGAVHLAGQVQSTEDQDAGSAAAPPELSDPGDFTNEFLAALETEIGEEALLLRETSDPDFSAGDSLAADRLDAADAEAFGQEGDAVAPRPAPSPLPVLSAPAEEEVEPPPVPAPAAAPFCAPAPETWWPSSAEDRMAKAAAGLPSFPEKFNILLLGLDRRDRRGILATGAEIPLDRLRRIPARSDVIMVFQFDFVARQVRVVSVPRDTRVKFGRGGGKVNAAYAFGREPLARKVVSGFLDLPIHRSVVVDWRAAKQCIALYKGLNLDYQGFTEKEMFWHLRKRSFARGDFQRIERQQRFLAAAWGEFLRYSRDNRGGGGPAAIVTREMLTMAMQQAYETVETDLSWDEVRLLNYAFRDYDPAGMVMTQVPGVGVLSGDSSSAVYYLSPVARHSFDDLIVRADRNPQP